MSQIMISNEMKGALEKLYRLEQMSAKEFELIETASAQLPLSVEQPEALELGIRINDFFIRYILKHGRPLKGV
jgi:hypothetical protein